MSNLVFLLVAVVISVVGVGILVLRSRPSSSSSSTTPAWPSDERPRVRVSIRMVGTMISLAGTATT